MTGLARVWAGAWIGVGGSRQAPSARLRREPGSYRLDGGCQIVHASGSERREAHTELVVVAAAALAHRIGMRLPEKGYLKKGVLSCRCAPHQTCVATHEREGSQSKETTVPGSRVPWYRYECMGVRGRVSLSHTGRSI